MIIIKVGGGTDTNRTGIAKDIRNLKEKVIFVHGARKQTNSLAEKIGHPTKSIVSPSGITSTYTDRKALEIMTMVYAGLLNKQWVQSFQQISLNAVGLSGADGRIWQGKRKKYLVSKEGKKQKLIKNTWTGKVEKVNTSLLNLLIDNDFLPVITQPAISYKGELINADNDRCLAVMAKALKIKKVIVLFEAPGLLRNPEDESSLIKKLKKEDLSAMMKYAKGTMKKKIIGAQEALSNGVKVIYWGDSRVRNPIKATLAGKGTIIK